MSEEPIIPQNPEPDPPRERFPRLTPDEELLLEDPYNIIPTQEELNAAHPSKDASESDYRLGKLGWEHEVLGASKRVVDGLLDKETTSHQVTRLKLEEKENALSILQTANEELEAELAKTRTNAILNFNKVAELRDERDELEKKAKYADIDYLTNILNRRGLEEKYRELVDISRHRRESADNSALFVDIDKFKDFNEQLSHAGGDEALKLVAKNIRTQIRESDIAGRWGGDEFIVILPDTKVEEATEIAEKIRVAIGNLRGLPVDLTISIGVGKVRLDQSLTKATAGANQAMQEAKKNGRNQVITLNGNTEPH